MVDFSKLNIDPSEGNTPTEVQCEMCGHKWLMAKRDAEALGGNCPRCHAGRWEGEGSKMLSALLDLESGLQPHELEFVESMGRERNRWRAQGFKPDHLPSAKQIKWLTDLYERLC
jgi:hypothetical protein